MNKGIKKPAIIWAVIMVVVTLMAFIATVDAAHGANTFVRYGFHLVTWAINQLLFPFGTDEVWRMILGLLSNLFGALGLLLIDKRMHDIGKVGNVILLAATVLLPVLLIISVLYHAMNPGWAAIRGLLWELPLWVFSISILFLLMFACTRKVGKPRLSKYLALGPTPTFAIPTAFLAAGFVNMWSDLVVYHLPTFILAGLGIVLTLLHRDTLMERLGFTNADSGTKYVVPDWVSKDTEPLHEDCEPGNPPLWKCEEETEEDGVCNTQNKGDALYCKKCGKRRKTLPWTCNECSEENNSWDGQFCEKCGAQRPTEQSPEPPPEPETEEGGEEAA